MNIYLQIIIFFILSNIASRLIIKYIRGNIYLRIIRITTAYLPYLSIFFFVSLPNISFNIEVFYLILSMIVAIILLIPEYKNFIFSIKKEYSFLHSNIVGPQLLSRLVEGTIVPIIEEMFFRGLIPINHFSAKTIIISILLLLLFNISHYFGKDKNLLYQMKLLIFSLCSIALYLLSGNLIYSIILHILYNLPYVYSNFHRYYFHR